LCPSARVDPAARLIEFVVLRSPHLVLADIRGHKGISASYFVKLLDHKLRLDDFTGIFVT